MTTNKTRKKENAANSIDLMGGMLAQTGRQPAAPKESVSENIRGGAAPDSSWTHFSVICSEDLVNKIRFIAREEGFSIREVVDKAFANFVSAYESKKGRRIKLKPQKKMAIDDIL